MTFDVVFGLGIVSVSAVCILYVAYLLYGVLKTSTLE